MNRTTGPILGMSFNKDGLNDVVSRARILPKVSKQVIPSSSAPKMVMGIDNPAVGIKDRFLDLGEPGICASIWMHRDTFFLGLINEVGFGCLAEWAIVSNEF